MNIFKEKRKALGMSQREFAQHTGIPVVNVSKMENGRLTLTTAIRFCNNFSEYEIKNLIVVKREEQPQR
jgi:transcriptional regulator with XRE-family HTH domain